MFSLVKNLLQDCDKGEAPTQLDDSRLIKISHELLSCMRQDLTHLKDVEETARKVAESPNLRSPAPVSEKDLQK